MSDHRFAKDIPFTQAEYARRLTKVRAAMAERELDALLVTDPSNMAWLTAYDGWSFYVHQAVIVLPDADPIWWGRAQDANGAATGCGGDRGDGVDAAIGAHGYSRAITPAWPCPDLRQRACG